MRSSLGTGTIFKSFVLDFVAFNLWTGGGRTERKSGVICMTRNLPESFKRAIR